MKLNFDPNLIEMCPGLILKIDIWYTEHNILFWLGAAAQRYV